MLNYVQPYFYLDKKMSTAEKYFLLQSDFTGKDVLQLKPFSQVNMNFGNMKSQNKQLETSLAKTFWSTSRQLMVAFRLDGVTGSIPTFQNKYTPMVSQTNKFVRGWVTF